MHFFIDHLVLNHPNTTQLNTPADPDAYGPDPNDLEDRYNTVSRFQLNAEAKAFACEAGLMIVQEMDQDPNYVNLILKPSNSDALVDVRYYIYRGIKKSSLIDSNSGQIQSSGNELIDRLRTNINNNPGASDAASILGFSNGILPSEFIDTLFDGGNALATPIEVNEGEWIGTFTDARKIGFQIVLNFDGYNGSNLQSPTLPLRFDLQFARARNYTVIVSTATNASQKRIKREEILNFIDPAAFWGLHLERQVGFSEYGFQNQSKLTRQTSTNSSSPDFLYAKLLAKFATKNRIYLDIRSEKGHSYNFYDNYRDTGQGNTNIGIGYQGIPATLYDYDESSWPIFSFDPSLSGVTQYNHVILTLRIDDNVRPIVYVRNRNFKHADKRSPFIQDDALSLNGTTYLTGWTKPFRLEFRNIGVTVGNTRPSVANYIKMNYYRQEHNASAPASVPANEKYYDSAFCSIDLPGLGDTNATRKYVESAEPIYVREPNNSDGTGNFGLNMLNGAYWDASRCLFYAIYQEANSGKNSGKEFLNTYDQDLGMAGEGPTGRLVHGNTEILCMPYQIGTSTIRIPGINLFRSGTEDANGGLTATVNHKENALLLGLSIPEVSSIKSASAQLGSLHHSFTRLVPAGPNPKDDAGGHRYFSYLIELYGVDANGEWVTASPLHQNAPIVLYSRDNQFFSSELFSSTEPLTISQTGYQIQNRIEFHIYHDGYIKVTDNKDLALVHDVERVYYVYHDNAGLVTQVCNLDLVMADRMKRVKTSGGNISWPSIPTDFAYVLNYQTIATQMGITGVDAGNLYRNPQGNMFISPGPTSGFGIQKFIKVGQKCFMVHFEAALVTANLNIAFSYEETLRFYARPDLAAAVVGAMIPLNHAIVCQGFAFDIAHCYPSGEHVNGEAFDTDYSNVTANDAAFINAMNLFGFTRHRIGNDAYGYGLQSYLENDDVIGDNNLDMDDQGQTLHQSHLHSTDVRIRNIERSL